MSLAPALPRRLHCPFPAVVEPSSSAARRWLPSFVKVRNFADPAEAKTLGVTRPDAEVLIGKLTDGLPTSIRTHLGPLRLRYQRNAELEIPLTADVAPEIQDIWNTMLRSNDEFAFYNNGHKRTLYVVPERSEREKPRYAAMGRTRKLLDSHKPVTGHFEFTYIGGWKAFHVKEDGARTRLASLDRLNDRSFYHPEP